MTYLEKATELYRMVNGGQLMEAFEKFYHTDVVMQELGEEPRVGKDTNRQHELNFLGMVKEFHGAGVIGITSNEAEQKTMVECWMELTFQDGNRVKIEQIASQTWNGEHIIKEVFYHK
ncbi:hypothetical protein SAMN05421780_11714 [Flexibacter flexilis DSM 6793]|uniref:SnoaL-like domain-containing protein n=1 Tax=Flexibacter flexilis DSM 6793 TaxID=927664 RepID=A0A1I1NUG4_9BACT|nr:hypothetical protein [Flexibacter flexilis]SFC99148.1 hypothetical protein SAMN05421780_11714 [Flexibacter flexilis DSM 6793]